MQGDTQIFLVEMVAMVATPFATDTASVFLLQDVLPAPGWCSPCQLRDENSLKSANQAGVLAPNIQKGRWTGQDGRAGQATKMQWGRAGQGRAGPGRAGPGRAGRGGAGQGRAGEGEEGRQKAQGTGHRGQGRQGKGRAAHTLIRAN